MSSHRRIVGLHAADSALHHISDKVVHAWVDAYYKTDKYLGKIVSQLSVHSIPVELVSKASLDRLAEGQVHQGIVLEVTLLPERGETELHEHVHAITDTLPFFLILDHVQDPHNVGACLRTADATGVQGIVITKDQSVGLTPTVAKVASGAAETVPIYRVTNLVRVLKWFKKAGMWIVGTAGEAERTVYETDLAIPLGIVIGNESTGLRRLTREHCDLLVSLPMLGTVESLNLSVATGVVLYEVVRQRKARVRSG